MIRIALIKTTTEAVETGDCLEAHEVDEKGNPQMTGIGYVDFEVLELETTVQDLQEIESEKEPEIREYKKSRKKELEMDGIFQEVTKEPKYRLNFSGLSSTEKQALKTSTKAVVNATLRNKVQHCLVKQFDKIKA